MRYEGVQEEEEEEEESAFSECREDEAAYESA
jgi:hypothetical protein